MSKPRKIGKSPLKKACSPKEVEVLESLGDIKYDDDSYDESPTFRIPRTQSKISEASPMTPREVFESRYQDSGAVAASPAWTDKQREQHMIHMDLMIIVFATHLYQSWI